MPPRCMLALAVVAAIQPGIGPTGTMYDGNNLARTPIARETPQSRPASPASTIGQGAHGASSDSTGGGAGGGEH